MEKLITLEQIIRIAQNPSITERSLSVILKRKIVVGNEMYWRMSDVKEWLKSVKEGAET